MTNRAAVGLLDTSVVIALAEVNAQDLPETPVISAITLAELSVGPVVAQDDTERQRRQLVLQVTESSFDPLPFDAACARRFAQVAGHLRRSGRTSRARALDALIASTALAHDLPLFTTHSKDFQGIPDLSVHEIPTDSA